MSTRIGAKTVPQWLTDRYGELRSLKPKNNVLPLFTIGKGECNVNMC